jgi:hypothetical protein
MSAQLEEAIWFYHLLM